MSEQQIDGLREYVASVVHDAWCKRATSECRPMSYDYEAADQILIAAGVADVPEVEITSGLGKPARCIVRQRGVVVFNGVDWSALAVADADS